MEIWKVMHFLFIWSILIVIAESRPRRCGPCICYNGDSKFEELEKTGSVYIMDCSQTTPQMTYSPHIDKAVTVLDFSNAKFETFPQPELLSVPHIRALLLRNNSLTSLPTIASSNNLEYLDITGNDIHMEEPGFPDAYNNINTIKLEGTFLNDNSFINFTKLAELKLVVPHGGPPPMLLKVPNVIPSLRRLTLVTDKYPPTFLHTLTSLVNFRLYLLSGVTSLPTEMFEVKNLDTITSLLINGPDLKIDNRDLLKNIPYLKEIVLELDNVEMLPHDVFYTDLVGNSCSCCNDPDPKSCHDPAYHQFHRMSLQSISISGVSELTDNRIFKLVNRLEYLNISGTDQSPVELLEAVPQLENIVFTYDNILKITPELLPHHLKYIEHLNMSFNNISIISQADFKNKPFLELLDLSHNLINNIHQDAFQHFGVSLKYLNLSHNNLCRLPALVFKGLTNLQYLSLQYNCLDELSPELFADLGKLTHLHLEVNQIKAIPKGLFLKLHMLEFLDLNQNRIVGLESTTLVHFYNSKMQRVDLTGNNIQSFPLFYPPINTSLKFFLLGENTNLTCDCGVIPLIRLEHIEGFCAKPEELKTTKISDLEPEDLCPETTVHPTTEPETTWFPTTELPTTELDSAIVTTTVSDSDGVFGLFPSLESPGGMETTTMRFLDDQYVKLTTPSSNTKFDENETTEAPVRGDIGPIPPFDVTYEVPDELDPTTSSQAKDNITPKQQKPGTTHNLIIYMETTIETTNSSSPTKQPQPPVGVHPQSDERPNSTVIRLRGTGAMMSRPGVFVQSYNWWIVIVVAVGFLALVGVAYRVYLEKRGFWFKRNYTINDE